MTDDVVEARDVAVRHEALLLLAPSTFRIPLGGCASITGANGSGKTTLLKIIAGRLAPTSGSIRVQGARVDDRTPDFRRAVSALIGLPAYYDDLTLSDHLELLDRVWKGETDTAVLDDMNISYLAKRFPRELSSGQQQLFHLALALARPADVLILDEPEQRLDDEHRANLGAILRRKREEGTTIVLATHDLRLSETVGTMTVRLQAPSEGLPQ